MRVRILGSVSEDIFSDRLLGEVVGEPGAVPPGASSFELTWARHGDGGAGADLPTRLHDVAAFLAAFRHRLLPLTFGAAEVEGGVALFHEPMAGVALSGFRGGLVPEPVALELLAEVADLLDFLSQARDPRTRRPLEFCHRALALPNLFLRPDGALRVGGLECFRALWSHRITHTAAHAAPPGWRFAPEQVSRGVDLPASDIFMLGLAVFELLADADLADQAAGIRGSGPEFDEQWFRLVNQIRVHASQPVRGLLCRMLRADPGARPLPGAVRDEARALGASSNALRGFAQARVAVVTPSLSALHHLAGWELELVPPGSPPAARPASSSPQGPEVVLEETIFYPVPIPPRPAPIPLHRAPAPVVHPFAGFSVEASGTMEPQIPKEERRRSVTWIVLGVVALAVAIVAFVLGFVTG